MLLVEYFFFDKKRKFTFLPYFIYLRKSKEEYDQEEERKRKKQVPTEYINIIEVFYYC